MLKNEARWLGTTLSNLDPSRLFPLLNVGSSTKEFRESDQPWIDEYVFRPLAARGGTVVHLDAKKAAGVDIAGDFNDPATEREIRARGIRSVFCSNMLEHVSDREGVARHLEELVAVGSYLIVSVPNAFPYHPDPIDTMFRPGLWELMGLFPALRPIDGEVVACGTVLGLLDRNVVRLSRKVAARVVGRGPRKEKTGAPGTGLAGWLNPWLVKEFRATCVLLEKRGSEGVAGHE